MYHTMNKNVLTVLAEVLRSRPLHEEANLMIPLCGCYGTPVLVLVMPSDRVISLHSLWPPLEHQTFL